LGLKLPIWLSSDVNSSLIAKVKKKEIVKQKGFLFIQKKWEKLFHTKLRKNG
jgi:hypothetical protein